jgi:hypothetical protein
MRHDLVGAWPGRKARVSQRAGGARWPGEISMFLIVFVKYIPMPFHSFRFD